MSDEDTGEASAPRKKGRGFFALDVNQFERIRTLNLGLEEAAAYLCLLKSTDQSNETSIGGIRSVTEYSGLTRAEAKKAVERLEKAGLLKSLDVPRVRAKTVPRYVLPIQDKRPRLAPKEQPVVDAIAAGQQPRGKVEANAAQRAQEKGYIEKGPDGWRVVEHGNEVAFIPNDFVAVSKGQSPLRRLMSYGELGPLMLAAELYQIQNLMEERGVPTSALRGHYYSETWTRIGKQHRLHSLQPGRPDPETGRVRKENFDRAYHRTWRGGDGFWANLRALEQTHIVEWAVYAANGKPVGGEFAFNRPQPERPLGVLRGGKHVISAPESLPALAAYVVAYLAKQGAASSPEPRDFGQLMSEWLESSPVVAIENQSVSHVEGVGILRMAHRARTENTKVWYRNTLAECRAALFFVEEVARASFPEALAIIQSLQARASAEDAISMIAQC